MASLRMVRSIVIVLLVAALVRIVLIGTPKVRTERDSSYRTFDTASKDAVIPLLPIVFFDSASSEIPERYDLEPLPNGSSSGYYRTLHDAYLRVLDVLAEQLCRSRESVVLRGYVEDADSMGASWYFARSRAERIRNYLVYDRGIDRRRIRVLHSYARVPPPGSSSHVDRRLRSEYRRVEILTSSYSPFPIMMRVTSATPAISKLNRSCIVIFGVRSGYVHRHQRQQIAAFLGSVPMNGELSITANSDLVERSESPSPIEHQRAARVAGLIRKIRPDCRIDIESNPASRSAPLGLPSLDLPEIRCLCRSVIIQQREQSHAPPLGRNEQSPETRGQGAL